MNPGIFQPSSFRQEGLDNARAISNLMAVIALFWEQSTPDEWRTYTRTVAHETGWRFLCANQALDEHGDLIVTPKAIYIPLPVKESK